MTVEHNYKLIKHKLVDIQTVKTVCDSVMLTKFERHTKNRAYASNGKPLKYIVANQK